MLPGWAAVVSDIDRELLPKLPRSMFPGIREQERRMCPRSGERRIQMLMYEELGFCIFG
jgi:hypothetical protein